MRVPGPGVRGLTGLLRLALRRKARRFARDLGRPEAAQAATLGAIVAICARSEYGRSHGLRPGDSYAEFRAKLPIVTYDDLAPWIDRQRRGDGPALVAQPVRHWEKTSGSAGPAKYIPHPAALRRSFHRMLGLWLHDLLAHGPRLMTGRTWISVSPNLGPREATPRGVPVGARDDREYLPAGLRILLAPFLVLPSAVGRLRDPDAFQHVAALLLLAGDPEVVSVWNPSFLTVLLRHVAAHRTTLRADWVAGGTVREGIAFRVPRPTPERLEALDGDPPDWPRLLPGLRLVSCWTDGPAAMMAGEIMRLFPTAVVQGKGLLATEAPLTIPSFVAGGCVPLVSEVFFELEDATGQLVRIHEAEPGATYALVISQRGGLCRYRLGDRVRVTHVHRRTPCLAFTGREGAVSDLVGEKLHEAFVAETLERLALPGCSFRTLVAVPPPGPAHYALVVDHLEAPPQPVADRLDGLLQAAHRYRQARALGQLAPLRVLVVSDAETRCLGHKAARGLRLGDIKPSALVGAPGAGSLLDAVTR